MKFNHPLRSLLVPFVSLTMLVSGIQAGDAKEGMDSRRSLPRLVDLGADKCIPCKMMAPILADLKKSYAGQLEVVFIDVWKNSEEGKRHEVRIIPTQIFYDASGKERFRHEGFMAKKDILAKWRELGVELTSPPASDPH